MTTPRPFARRLVLIAIAVAAGWSTSAQAADEQVSPGGMPVDELRMLVAQPGRCAELLERVRRRRLDSGTDGVTTLACLVPVDGNPEGRLAWLVRYPDAAAAAAARQAFEAEPARESSNGDASRGGDIVRGEERITLTPTEYSPRLTPAATATPRVFELRTYTCPSRDHLALLHERFRSHTMGLFAKHGMENLAYWHPQGVEAGERKLVYLLGHASVEAAKKSFAAFRADPEWLAAKEASERKAGGPLTEKQGGVVSAFFVGTDDSPLR